MRSVTGAKPLKVQPSVIVHGTPRGLLGNNGSISGNQTRSACIGSMLVSFADVETELQCYGNSVYEITT
jgi:hypothetical protein